MFVLEKYFMRTSICASMKVTIDNFEGTTEVQAVASGSAEGVFFDSMGEQVIVMRTVLRRL